MNNWNQSTRNDERNDDKPPYSRVFVVCSRQMREDDLRPVFEKFGTIEDIHIPRDRNTGDSRGIAYIKYAKTSSAASAIQELHMTTLPNSHKPIKVMVAANKNESQSTNQDKYKRLFIKVHKEITENEIRHHFSSFGRVESVRLQRDKITEECKGFAYVHYKTFIDAAKAYEECDRKYRPIFATPKDELKRGRNSLDVFDSYSSNSSLHKEYYHNDSNHTRDTKRDNAIALIKTKPQEYDTLSVICSPPVLQKHIERLFSIVPGMLHCKYSLDLYNGYCKALITYDTEKAAAYALEKLNNFEYPSGEVISIKPDDNPLSKAASNLTNIVNNIKNAVDGNPDLLQLADAIAQASSLIKAASSGRDMKSESQDNYCSVSLPPVQPMANSNSKVAQRCFLVFKPHPPPVSVLRDTFCRFGDLIDVATFPNKTFGFAKYASSRAAQEAIRTLHEATLCGIKLKVLEADEKISNENKLNTDEEQGEQDHDMESKRMKLDKDN